MNNNLRSTASGTVAEENEAPAFFCDLLPKEVLDNVLRYLSHIPNAKYWKTQIEVRDVLEILAVRGEFGVFIKSRFTALYICKTKNCKRENDYNGWKERTGPYLRTKDFKTAREFVFGGGGQSLKTLFIGFQIFEDESGGEDLVDDLLNQGPNLTSLSIERDTSSGMKGIENQIERLEIASNIPLDFPLYCTTLLELNLSSHSYHISSTNLWQRIGCILETLERSC